LEEKVGGDSRERNIEDKHKQEISADSRGGSVKVEEGDSDRVLGKTGRGNQLWGWKLEFKKRDTLCQERCLKEGKCKVEKEKTTRRKRDGNQER